MVEEPANASRSTQAQGVAASIANGYYHQQSNSLFRLGQQLEQRSEFGLNKTIGSEGVFATHAGTRAAIAIPNANAPCLSAAPLTPADVHSQRVQRYFTDRGLRAEEIGAVNVTTEMTGGGPAGSTSMPTVVRYNSGLVRVLDGVPVVDSVAWAAFTTNDEVCKEEVDWPAIPSSVIANAHALQQLADDPVRFADFAGKLPTLAKSGQVVIRHSRWMSPNSSSTVSFAAMDIPDKGGVRHFDANAQELHLPGELPATTPSVGR